MDNMHPFFQISSEILFIIILVLLLTMFPYSPMNNIGTPMKLMHFICYL